MEIKYYCSMFVMCMGLVLPCDGRQQVGLLAWARSRMGAWVLLLKCSTADLHAHKPGVQRAEDHQICHMVSEPSKSVVLEALARAPRAMCMTAAAVCIGAHRFEHNKHVIVTSTTNCYMHAWMQILLFVHTLIAAHIVWKRLRMSR